MVSTNPDPGIRAPAERVPRYPGVQPFGDDEIQRRLFRGREEEKYELLQLVLAERLVLLFARSGIGKSSLINAGLLEPLRDRGYFPIVVRVSGSAGGPVDCLYDGIKAALNKAEKDGAIEYEPPESEWTKSSLWHFFKTLELWEGDTLLSPVLVIDQCEELFTLHSVEQRKRFIHELADLVRGTRPQEKSGQDSPKLSDAPPEVKVILSLREDFYANLEELRDRIPSIYKAPFRLKPLAREQARRAIVEPAELEGEHFWTPAFAWSDEALATVLDFLSEQHLGEGKTKIGKEVEPFQLQLICQHVEVQAAERKLKTVTPDDLGGLEALKAVLSNFYEDTLRKVCEEFPQEQSLRERLERLCEYGFITAKGRRLLREESTIKQDDGVGPEVLRELVELRLLRKEPRVGDTYYELTHDTLIEPIQLSRQAREEQRARAARAAQRKMRKQLMAAGALATLVLLATGMWALWERAETQRATLEAKRAVAAEQQAQAEKQEFVKVAVKASLEAGKAEAEAKLAEIKPLVHAAQNEVATAKVQATKAKGQNYEEDAKRLVAEAEAKLRGATQQFEKASMVVYDAKAKVLDSQLASTVPPVSTVDSPGITDETELKARAKGTLAKLELRESEPEITDAELVRQYREFLTTWRNDLSAEEAQNIENKISELEQAAETFAELTRKDKDPNFSVCEAFDRWTTFQSRRTVSPEARYRDLRLAELNALIQDSVVVTTQQNFITSKSENAFDLNETFTLGKDRVYMHAWVNSPRSAAVELTLKRGDTEEPILNGKVVEKNPLRGVRIGYHLWAWKSAQAVGVGRHEIRLYAVEDAKNTLICRREYQIVR